jgi:hypothetical protein
MTTASHTPQHVPICVWLKLIAALTIAMVTAPYWLFFDRDDEEEPEPLPEELRKAAESQDRLDDHGNARHCSPHEQAPHHDTR